MTSPTVVRGGPREILAFAFYVLGFRPRESLLVLGVSGRRTIRPVVRCGLSAEECRSALEPLVRAGADSVMLVIVSDVGGPGPVGVARAWESLLDVMPCLVADAGLELLDLLVVGPRSWRSTRCRDESCCPEDGIPLAELDASQVAAEMVAAGRTVLDDESRLIDDLDPDEPGVWTPALPEREPAAVPTSDGPTSASPMDALPTAAAPSVGAPPVAASPGRRGGSRAARTGSRNVRGGSRNSHSEELTDLFREWLQQWRAAVADGSPAEDEFRPSELTAADLEWLTCALFLVTARDALLYALWPGVEDLAEQALVDPEGISVDLTGVCPDPGRFRRAGRLLAALARTAPPGQRGEALAVLAWLAWWAGESVRARLLVERALAERPEYRMAQLVDALLANAVPPGWLAASPDHPSGGSA